MEQEKIEFFHETPIQIRFNDIDSLGHVNNTKIQEYFDLGRMEYFKTVFGADINWNTFAAIIASNKTDFYSPVLINNQLYLQTKVTKIGTKSFQLIQHLTDTSGLLKATCHSVMVGFNHKTQSSMEITNEWRGKMNIVEHGTILMK
ncbi:acyl-CoA thioesterase [Plebeiibacterium marinum]|uniref:Acyl-CoA thioesterase n=1 Tax=Plebeiibacterium marinum TaxID=2992111 RepID=A0AAE3MDX8_9BACT|nr:acyl-CoA thioesterase [Plebeiobacterium marinum]MCW3805247.1 acyl-CoA thioesterase [Plebeiobacterium marinum]